jgi:hypothetical protein
MNSLISHPEPRLSARAGADGNAQRARKSGYPVDFDTFFLSLSLQKNRLSLTVMIY